MSHDYAITVGGTALSGVVASSRFVKYTAGAKRGTNQIVPFKHGELAVLDKYFTSADVMLEVVLPKAAVDDASEALTIIQRLFAAQGLVTVAQIDPHKGAIQARVELITEAIPTQDRFVYLFGLNNPAGFWEAVTASTAASASPPVVTTAGDRPIDDMVLTFAGPGFLQHTDSLGQLSRLTVEAAAGAGTYIVDVGAGIVTKGGVDQDEFFDASQSWWMKWQPGVAQSFTSDVAVAASWRNKYA